MKVAKITITVELTDEEFENWKKTNELQFELKEHLEKKGRCVICAESEKVIEED